MAFCRQVDVRYVGQSFELTVPLPGGNLKPGDVAGVSAAFHREQERAYGYAAPEEPVEWVNLRLTAIGKIVKPCLQEMASSSVAAQKDSRPVYFAERNGTGPCAIYDRYQLRAGGTSLGPAIVEEFDSTTVIHPGYQAIVDSFGNLLIKQFGG